MVVIHMHGVLEVMLLGACSVAIGNSCTISGSSFATGRSIGQEV